MILGSRFRTQPSGGGELTLNAGFRVGPKHVLGRKNTMLYTCGGW